MRAVLLFFLAACVISALGARTAVDLWWNQDDAGSQPGYISLPLTTLGSTGAVTFEIQCFLDAEPGNIRSSLIYFGKRNTHDDDLEVYFQNKQLVVRVGTEALSSSYVVPVVKTWTYIAVVIQNDVSSGLATAQLWVNGVDVTGTLANGGRFSRFALTSGDRNYNFLGYSTYQPPSSGAWNFKGWVDSFTIWGMALPKSTIQSHALLTDGTDPAFTSTGLIVRYTFDEAVGNTARGRIGSLATQTHVATLATPFAVFEVFNGGIGWTWCQGWGDPHWTDYNGKKFDTVHVEGYFNDLTCASAADGSVAFTVQTWHMTGCCWGGATVIRAVNVRLGNSVIQWAGPQAIKNGLAGPWVYKEIPATGSATNTGWTSFTPQRNVPFTLSSGLTVSLLSASGHPEFKIFGAPYGYIWVRDVGDHAYLDMYTNDGGDKTGRTGTCRHNGFSYPVCKGWSQPVGSWVFNSDPPVGPVAPLSAPPPVAPPPPQTCPENLQNLAEASCERCYEVDSEDYKNCVSDACFTGNPTPCQPTCTPGQICCTCSAHGDCVVATDNSTSCTCDQGWGGKNCDQNMNLVSLSLTTNPTSYDGRTYTMSPHDLAEAVSRTAETVSPSTLANANPWFVKNSLLIYVGTVQHALANGEVGHSQHLYVVHDATSYPLGFNHELTMTATRGTFSTPIGLMNTGVSVSVANAGSNNHAPTKAVFSTSPLQPTGFVVPYLDDDWCIEFRTQAEVAAGQVVVGSGNLRGQLELLRVVDSNTAGFTVCGKKINDNCPNLMDCATCTADAECGWCRTTGTCHRGRPAGPVDGSICPAWAFTFSDVTRRITETYGYPVSPVDTTVVLSKSDHASMPIEIKVDMAYRFYSAWDVQILIPRSAGNAAEVSGFQNSIGDIADYMAANFPNSGLSAATYGGRANPSTPEGNGDSGVFHLVFSLVDPRGRAQIQNLANGITVTNNNNNQLALALARASATQQPGWRNNARHLMIIFATSNDLSSPADIKTAASNLLAYNVMPIFIVSPNFKAFYQNYVNELGFGVVIDYTSPSAMGVLFDRAMVDASGIISVTNDPEHPGMINMAQLTPTTRPSLTVTGMTAQMRARAVFPIAPVADGRDTYTVLLAPGFGKSTIEAIESDSPYTNGVPVHIVVGQQLDPYTTAEGTIAYLTGAPADVLQSTAVVQAYVHSLSRGSLYQFSEQALRSGVAPTALEPINLSGGPVAVKDVQGRVIYVPPTNEFGNALDEVYATITYRVDDECSSSPIGPLPIYVQYANNKNPTTSHAASNTMENQAVVIDFSGTDYREHELTLEILGLPSNSVGNNTLSGTLYAYSAACWQAVSNNFKDVAGCTPLAVGSMVDATSVNKNGPANTWITHARVIYVPSEYANSDGIPAVYKTVPTMKYRFVQIKNQLDIDGGFASLATDPVSFNIVIGAVNQAPYVNLQTVFRSWLSFPSLFVDVDPNACSSAVAKCTFDQNLGIEYPNLPAPLSLFFSGFDVDSEDLSVKITALNCANGARLENVIDESSIQVGDVLTAPNYMLSANSWRPLARFLPTQDGSGDPYCSLKYRVLDGEAQSQDEGSIVISINHKPMEPRSRDYRFFAPTLETLSFEFAARSVNDIFTNTIETIYVTRAEIVACQPNGDFTSQLVIAPNTAPLDCNTVSRANPYTILVPASSNVNDEEVSSGMEHTFTGEWTPTAASIAGLDVVVRYFDSHQPQLMSAEYTLSFAFRQVNQAPQLQFIAPPGENQADFAEQITANVSGKIIGNGFEGSMGLHARDKDSGLTGVTPVYIRILDDPDKHVILMYEDSTGVVTAAPGGVHGYDIEVANIYTVDTILSTLMIRVTGIPAGEDFKCRIHVEVHDQGYTGACSHDDVNRCDKVATAMIYVHAKRSITATAVGIAAGAGGAAAAAAAGAAIAWRALREPPTESYNPWEMDDASEGTVMNPLFEDTGKSGDNPMFEAAGAN